MVKNTLTEAVGGAGPVELWYRPAHDEEAGA